MTEDKKHYVSNKKLYLEMIDYHKLLLAAKEQNLPTPPVTESIGEKIFLIASKMAYKPNFANYSYKQDMISEGVHDCLYYGVRKFNPTKYNNPFGYFSMIIKTAFIRCILKEKKQLICKARLLDEAKLMGVDVSKFISSDYEEYLDDVLEKNKDKLLPKKKKKKVTKNNIKDIIE